ncbi:hypothetical protein [Paraburkholderia caribensis]|uniref:hypothetical protein n=1 Tax=Paraburkholderia caribensis TaxID=75105 RepID=UPI001D08B401|nr:hypothetical protein [Paraburkholderia caribensis]
MGATHIAAAAFNVPKLLINALAAAYTTVKDLADGYGTVLSVLGVVAASYSLLRCARNAKRRVSEVWSRKAQEIYARLCDDPTELENARAHTDLMPFIATIDELVAKLVSLEKANAQEPSNDAYVKIAEETREELSSALSALAIEIARKDVTFDTVAEPSADESATQTRGPVWFRALTGERFCKDVGLLKKPLSRFVTALLFVTLIGWAADPLANSVQLIVNNLRVNLLAQQASRDLDSVLSRAKPDADDITPNSPPNLAAINEASRLLARAAVREMVQSPLMDRVVSIERTRENQTEFVRAAINEQNYKTDETVSADATEKVREEASRAAMHPGATEDGLGTVERELASDLRPSVQRLASENPGRFQRIVDEIKARYAAPMGPLDAQGKLIGEALDKAFGAFDAHATGEVSKQAEKLVKEFGKKALTEWAQAFAQRFVTQAIMDTAHPEVWARVHDNFRFETSTDAQRFLVALNASDGHGMHNVAADDEARMHRKVAEFLSQTARDDGARHALLAQMSGYDSLFPLHDDDPGVAGFDHNGPSPGGGGGGESGRSFQGEGHGVRAEGHVGTPRAFTTARARSFGLASLSFRVRGVLIGQDEESVGIDITDLAWTIHPANDGLPTRVTLQARMSSRWFTLGTFDAAVVNQALRYAADGRVIATTITPGDGIALARLTYVHPALVDTPSAAGSLKQIASSTR